MDKRNLSIEALLDPALALPEPEPGADLVRCSHRGIAITVGGILHGLTGGSNLEYKAFAADIMNKMPRPLLGEWRFVGAYPEVAFDGEINDVDALTRYERLGINLLALRPDRLYSIARSMRIERRTTLCNFRRTRSIHDICGSPHVHLLDPLSRRRLIGIPSPAEYFALAEHRRRSRHYNRLLRIPDPSWQWFEAVEPFAAIPIRSLYMLRFATAFAMRAGFSHVSIAVGETHNSDIAWQAAALEKGWLPSCLGTIDRLVEKTLEG